MRYAHVQQGKGYAVVTLPERCNDALQILGPPSGPLQESLTMTRELSSRPSALCESVEVGKIFLVLILDALFQVTAALPFPRGSRAQIDERLII